MEAIIADGLIKKYADKTAVNGVSFRVNQGEIFGLIGPDGAGKTSIFRMLTTLLLPDGGAATVDGFDIVKDYKQIRNRVGYMPGKFSLYPDLSIEENLNFFATVFNTTVAENYELIKDIYIQIEPFKKRRAGKLSGGMKQKLALCCALIHKPSVLFLDEPTTGVDPVSRKEFWEMLKTIESPAHHHHCIHTLYGRSQSLRPYCFNRGWQYSLRRYAGEHHSILSRPIIRC